MLQGWCVASSGSNKDLLVAPNHTEQVKDTTRWPGRKEITITVFLPGSTEQVNRHNLHIQKWQKNMQKKCVLSHWWGEAVINQGNLHWSRSFKQGFNKKRDMAQ